MWTADLEIKKLMNDTGDYQECKGILINADVNGALNIVRKAIPEAFGRTG